MEGSTINYPWQGGAKTTVQLFIEAIEKAISTQYKVLGAGGIGQVACC
jgi:hypothetical protein